MMKYLQRLGKSLMLPVAVLPLAGLLLGIGYGIDASTWGSGSIAAAFLMKAGAALIDNMGILFAIGVGIGMSDDGEGTSALAALVSFLMMRTLLSPAAVEVFTGEPAVAAFSKINDGNQFMGIVAGLIGAHCYNKFKNTQLPMALSFFSGKRSVAFVTGAASIVSAIVLFFIWPTIYGALVAFGEAIISTGAIGAGIYAFFNRLLIPFGLHHALNSVFWFDIANINDIGRFWGTVDGGVVGQTGMYMSGFFPIMMFGLPAAALAMYHTAKDSKKKTAAGFLFAAAICSFVTGVTEPLEFAFMFLAPVLYVIHALLTGISAFIVAALPIRAGFNFSAGLIDYLLSFAVPMAVNPILLIPVGLGFGAVYYGIFRFVITKFNLKTPGREDDEISEGEMTATLSTNNFTAVAHTILEGLGGKGNITSIDNCVTRLRIEIKDYTQINEKKIKSSGAQGIIRPSKTSVQVIIGTQVQFVADEIKKITK